MQNSVASLQGYLFEEMMGEVFEIINKDIKPQYDLSGDGTSIIDYFDEIKSIGYECKLTDLTAFKGGCGSLKKYPKLVNTLFIVYAKRISNRKLGNGNIKFVHADNFINKLSNDLQQHYRKKLIDILNMKGKEYQKICKHCGDHFTTEWFNKIYCSETCLHRVAGKRYYMKKRSRKTNPLSLTCKTCSKSFVSEHAQRLYCSDLCKPIPNKVEYVPKTKPCENNCGKRVRLSKGTNLCSECYKETQLLTRECLHCGESFITGSTTKKYCSEACGYQVNAKRSAERYRENNCAERTFNQLTKELFFEIYEFKGEGLSNYQVAERFGVTDTTVRNIKNVTAKKYKKWIEEGR
ncbi:hypothetical protein PDJ86_22325 [Bacillus cereus group sp. TH36-2LC]|uniref:hypothetical protein n=1 Tax=Bacillus cereus group sp. TH36-2LC TaxID=3018040 RepID=UPI0022E08896|nr:hypothetical protein [Bacillus cereus group sp. TH36-2LC]MDA1509596.1 hypothetical protein [Bacillus cereus group sp. TH36-2LC]